MRNVSPALIQRLKYPVPEFSHTLAVPTPGEFTYWDPFKERMVVVPELMPAETMLASNLVPIGSTIAPYVLQQFDELEPVSLVRNMSLASGQRYQVGVVIHPCASQPGLIQATEYDAAGLFPSHTLFMSVEDAVTAYARTGYVTADTMLLEQAALAHGQMH